MHELGSSVASAGCANRNIACTKLPEIVGRSAFAKASSCRRAPRDISMNLLPRVSSILPRVPSLLRLVSFSCGALGAWLGTSLDELISRITAAARLLTSPRPETTFSMPASVRRRD